jgi:hypothetical protein
MTVDESRNLSNRALAAYYRAARDGAMQPSEPKVVEHGGLQYVVLSSVNGVLAVYRVRTVNGKQVLKGLRRWPKELGAAG